MPDSPPNSIPTTRGFLGIAGQQLIGIAISFGVWVLVARMLPVAEFGEFTAAFGLAMIGGTFANLGLPQYVMVPFRSAQNSGDFDIARGMRRAMPWFLLGSGVLAYGVIIVAKWIFGSDCTPREESVTTVLALLPLFSLMSYLRTTAQAHGAPRRATFLTGAGLYLLIALGLWVAWMRSPEDVDILDVATSWVAANLIICIALWHLNISVEDDRFKEGSGTVPWRRVIGGAFPFFLSSLAAVLLVQAPFPILGWVCDEGREAALFAAADRLCRLISVAAFAGTALFLPLLADAIQTGDRMYYGRLIRSWLVLVGVTNLVVLGLLAVFGPAILRLYGDAYSASYPILLVTGTSIALTATLSIFLKVLQYAGGARISTVICVSMSGVGLAVMVGLGFVWGAIGVAAAQGGIFVFMYVLLTLKARHLMDPGAAAA